MSLLSEEIAQLQDSMTADFIQHAQQVFRKENQRIRNSSVAQQAPKVGDFFPHFIMPNAYGQLINSRDLISQGPLIISFFKGRWSPCCDSELRAFQYYLPEIKSRNAQLAAITPMLPRHCLEIQNNAGLDYEVLSDIGNRLAGELDLTYCLAPEAIEVFERLGYDLANFNGDPSWKLPIPATYLVDSSGKIALAYTDVDSRKRLNPKTIISTLSAIQDQAYDSYTTNND